VRCAKSSARCRRNSRSPRAHAIEVNTVKLLQKILDDYGAGVLITQIQLRTIDPPSQVLDAFPRRATRKADRERARNEAEGYRNDIVPRARGEAQRLIQEAEAYRQQVEAQANGEAQRSSRSTMRSRRHPT